MLVLLISILLTSIYAQQCANSNWPVYAGGFDGSSIVNCFTFDLTQELVIVGGYTNSPYFAPDDSQHAFIYALDLDGNWKWGNYFRNSSIFELAPISDIQSCQLSSDKTSLAVLGVYDETVPVLFTISTQEGQIESMITFDGNRTRDTTFSLDTIFLDDTDNIIWTESYYYIGLTW